MSDSALLEKLAALKALAECPTGNPNETAAAAAQMTRLMLKYGIEMEAIKAKEDKPKNESIYKEYLCDKSQKWKELLMANLAMAANSKAIGMGNEYFLIGTKDNLSMIRYQFNAVLNDILRLCPYKKLSREWTSFCYGAAVEVCRRVNAEKEALKKEYAQNVTALACLNDAITTAQVESLLDIKLKQARAAKRPSDAGAYWKGRKAGESITLSGNGSKALGPEKRAIR